MSTTLLQEAGLHRRNWMRSLFSGWTRGLAQASLRGLPSGCITIRDAGGKAVFGDPEHPMRASIRVGSADFYPSLVLGGTVGAAESYMRGDWSCDDLTMLTRIIARNRETLDRLEGGLARLAEPGRRLLHRLHKNTIRGSRKNIQAHYDLSNRFYQLFLDPTLTYSCGIFETPETSMEQASIAKLDRICRKLRLSERDHVLEIGTGWGSFALHAAGRYGCRVTTTTISHQQYELAARRIREAGLEDRIQLLSKDYRALEGKYDKLVSIEMIEAVGHHYYESFFARCAGLLKEEGSMLLQAITIADWNYEAARKGVDFIKKYIFPGSCIPSITALLQAAVRGSDLRLFHLEDLTPHYARTLRRWRERFLQNSDRIRALGFSSEFMRMWEFYLSYCEGGFEERVIGSVQMLWTRPRFRGAPLLPDLERA